jgi:hypothetical protein
MMPLWAWTLMGATSVLALSALVGLAAGAILGSMSREVSELLEMEPRSSGAPEAREDRGTKRLARGQTLV